jgi:hypothetical protein
MASLAKKGVKFSEIQEARWGSITQMRLPGGGTVGLYQPNHAGLFFLLMTISGSLLSLGRQGTMRMVTATVISVTSAMSL